MLMLGHPHRMGEAYTHRIAVHAIGQPLAISRGHVAQDREEVDHRGLNGHDRAVVAHKVEDPLHLDQRAARVKEMRIKRLGRLASCGRILLANSKVLKFVFPTCLLGRQKSLGNLR